MTNTNNSLEKNFKSSKVKLKKKLDNFPRYVERREIATFINRNEIYKKILSNHGCIIDCGVNQGSSLFTWMHLRNIYEPYNSSRYIYGFDTFDGFYSLDRLKDSKGIYLDKQKFKNFSYNQSYEEINESLKYHESVQVTKHLPKTEIIKGDAIKTIPKFIKDNPHTFISLLHLDFDIYQPTKVALRTFIKRMSKGAIIAFDELGCHEGPGVTLATLEEIGIKNYKVNRNQYDSFLCYIEL